MTRKESSHDRIRPEFGRGLYSRKEGGGHMNSKDTVPCIRIIPFLLIACIAVVAGSSLALAAPCSTTPFPTCGGGDCPAFQFCQPEPGTGACVCNAVPDCDSGTPFPECEGGCPAGLQCVDSPGGFCECRAPSCSQSAFPLCDVSCPPGEVCVPDTTTTPPACRCEPTPSRPPASFRRRRVAMVRARPRPRPVSTSRPTMLASASR